MFRISQLKFLAAAISVEKIDADAEGGRLLFNEQPTLDPNVIINLIQTQAHKFKLAGANQLRFIVATDSAQKRLDCVQTVLQQLTPLPKVARV